MKKIILSIDPGKGFTKYAKTSIDGTAIYDEFETRYTEVDNLNDVGLIGKNSYAVEFEGKKVILGTQGKKDLRDERNKQNPIHRLASLVAVTQMISPISDVPEVSKLTLMVSMPGTTYKSKAKREEFAKYYKGDGVIETQVNNQAYKFEIEDVIPMPEGAGFQFVHPQLCKGKVAIVDLGHLNIGLTVFKDENIEEMTSLDEGGEILEQLAIERLETQIGEKVSRSVILETLKNGYYKQFGEKVPQSDEIISNVKNEYVNDIIAKSKKKGVSLADMDEIRFIGGTSLLLKNDIGKHAKLSKTAKVLDDGKWITVLGNLIYGEGKFNGGANE